MTNLNTHDKKLSGVALALCAIGGPERNRVSKLARLMGVKRQTVYHWCKLGEIPASRVKQASTLLRLPPHLLNNMFSSWE
uniref:Putative HTH-type transcriptional regulator n=1 Tax=Myoviridae sp. cteBs22 TaxID=2826675 RepID=A0A8S5QZW0_9CAUD|nr:MAG TPA: putative HTH-type transcriptional regulator [Myoviridae sp. cteBs22]